VCLKPEKNTDTGQDFIRATVQGKLIRESFQSRPPLGCGNSQAFGDPPAWDLPAG